MSLVRTEEHKMPLEGNRTGQSLNCTGKDTHLPLEFCVSISCSTVRKRRQVAIVKFWCGGSVVYSTCTFTSAFTGGKIPKMHFSIPEILKSCKWSAECD